MNVDNLESPYKDLVKAAVKAKDKAYCPYSNFHVGASILTSNDQIFTGVNVENASYGLCVCAERVAIMNAVSQGHKEFKAMAVCCDIKDSFKAPCGACRQVFAEFNLNMDFYMVKPDYTSKKITVGDLLPMAFTPASLQEERV
ncbi:cytidine deaminase-like isoform X1 [Saccostrea echinata]|uniref:cytidine deaminase-like isoform X1 n=1 Tax=Saccostrea echinata TaxID=191078 RepID=UPI002A832E02|nr:cytidine deaminase-like isoform X1 [Saccostrea echinata]